MLENDRERDNVHIHPHRKRYEILVAGRYLEHQVKIRWTDRGRKSSTDVERLIDSAWRERMARGAGKPLFPGPLCRLEKYAVSEGELSLELGPTDYRELIGTNVCHPEIARSHGPDYLSNALAVHCAVITADRRILVFRRSGDVGEYPGAYDVCGGHIDPTIDIVRGVPDPFGALRREMEEEIGLRAAEINGLICRGLIRNTTTLKPDLIFDVWTDLPWAQIEKRGLDEEHRSMHYIEDSASGVRRFLRDHIDDVAPAGTATLELHVASQ